MKETYEQRKARLTKALRLDKDRDEVADYRKHVAREPNPPPLVATAEEKASIVRDWGEDDPPPGFLEGL